MKKLSLLLLVIAIATSSFAEIKNMDNTTVKRIATDEIVTSLKIYDNVEVILTNDELNEVQIAGEKNDVENIVVKISNGELTITTTGNNIIKEKVVVYVPSKALNSVSIHGSSQISSTEILGNEMLEVTINGEGKSYIRTAGQIYVNTIGDFPLESSFK